MSGLLIGVGFLVLSGLLMRWMDRAFKRPPLIELTRFTTNEAATSAYEARRDALGHGTARNVRDATT